MSDTSYVPYSDDVEQIQPDEANIVKAIVESMARGNEKVFDKHRHGLRDAHAKSHGIVKGELRVHDNLPAHLRQGLFAESRTFPIVVRFSTAPGDLRSDLVATPRGMAIKIIGVEGERALADDAVTQDFLLVNSPVIPFGEVRSYLKFQEKAENLSEMSDSSLQRLSAGARVVAKALDFVHIDPPAQLEGIAESNSHILGQTFHSMAALRYGAFIAKISAAPASESVRVLTDVTIPSDASASVLRDLVVEFFKSQSAEYEVRAQLCTNLERMPVEDGSVVWAEDESPQQPIATIVLPQQDAYSNTRRIYGDDVLSFTPWHALAAHRPLGSIMRVRVQAYERSSKFRHEMNGVPRVEPRSIDEVPD